ncbi:GNAT family N-acetyltransferase [Streptomyces sp. NPDC004549]|uniref:GNAT family N-acetyltransferase n=1 Tax=Streptomyces sp. NPDC004549 TaxID=3154283 RepID=UPI0033A4F7AF
MDHAPPPPTTPAVRLPHYTPADQAEILGDGPDPFGVADTGLTFLPKEIHFGIKPHDRLIAHTGLLELPLSIGPLTTEVIGVGGVAVAPDVRGQGLARRVLTTALTHARTLGPHHALLFCRPPFTPFYEHLGWHTLTVNVHVEQPQGAVLMPLRTMWTPLREGAEWADGEVRLLSYPM